MTKTQQLKKKIAELVRGRDIARDIEKWKDWDRYSPDLEDVLIAVHEQGLTTEGYCQRCFDSQPDLRDVECNHQEPWFYRCMLIDDGIGDGDTYQVGGYLCFHGWELGEPLENQSEETKQFLFEILCEK